MVTFLGVIQVTVYLSIKRESSRSCKLLHLWWFGGTAFIPTSLSCLVSCIVNSTCISSLNSSSSHHFRACVWLSVVLSCLHWGWKFKVVNWHRWAWFLCFSYFRSHCLSFPHVQCLASHFYIVFSALYYDCFHWKSKSSFCYSILLKNESVKCSRFLNTEFFCLWEKYWWNHQCMI